MDLQELHSKVERYDRIIEEGQQQWEKIKELKPKAMNELTFQSIIQQARLDNMMISNFNKNEALKCKSLIYRGANKQYLYNYVSKINSGNLTMIQSWLLEDLHNIRREKNLPYTYDREISDVREITKTEYERLLKKLERKEEFTFDEKDCFLLEDEDNNGKMYIAIDNTSSEMWVEEFLEKETAERYLKGENIDKLKEEIAVEKDNAFVNRNLESVEWEEGIGEQE